MRRAPRHLLRAGRAGLRAGAASLARHRRACPRAIAGSVLAANLKVSGVPVFSMGDFEGEGAEAIAARGPGAPAYRKLVVRDGRLAGAVLFGDTADALWYRDLIRQRRSIAPIRGSLAFGRAYRGGRLMSGQDFTEEQRRYLEGFVSGVQARARRRLEAAGAEGGGAAEPAGPDDEHLAAMARFEAAGKKLSPEEKAKRDEHPFDAYARLKAREREGAVPQGRRQFPLALPRAVLRRAGAELLHVPAAHPQRHPHALAAARRRRPRRALRRRLRARDDARQPADPRDRAPSGAVALLEGLADLGIAAKGAGADNIRNVTGSPTAGIDPQELLDTRPYARAWHHHILNDRSLYGLPRKFNVGFDGGGVIPVLEDTNDIAFTAVRVSEGAGVEPGVWFRLGLGGITGHQDFARYDRRLVRPRGGRRGGGRHRARLHRPTATAPTARRRA